MQEPEVILKILNLISVLVVAVSLLVIFPATFVHCLIKLIRTKETKFLWYLVALILVTPIVFFTIAGLSMLLRSTHSKDKNEILTGVMFLMLPIAIVGWGVTNHFLAELHLKQLEENYRLESPMRP